MSAGTDRIRNGRVRMFARDVAERVLIGDEWLPIHLGARRAVFDALGEYVIATLLHGRVVSVDVQQRLPGVV